MSLDLLLSLKHADLIFHTKDHFDLTLLDYKEKQEQLTTKLAYINSDIIVYPMGKFDDEILQIVEKNNVILGFTVLPFHISKNTNKHKIPRICINGYLTRKKYKFFTSKLGNVYLYLAFLKRKILSQNYLNK